MPGQCRQPLHCPDNCHCKHAVRHIVAARRGEVPVGRWGPIGTAPVSQPAAHGCDYATEQWEVVSGWGGGKTVLWRAVQGGVQTQEEAGMVAEAPPNPIHTPMPGTATGLLEHIIPRRPAAALLAPWAIEAAVLALLYCSSGNLHRIRLPDNIDSSLGWTKNSIFKSTMEPGNFEHLPSYRLLFKYNSRN